MTKYCIADIFDKPNFVKHPLVLAMCVVFALPMVSLANETVVVSTISHDDGDSYANDGSFNGDSNPDHDERQDLGVLVVTADKKSGGMANLLGSVSVNDSLIREQTLKQRSATLGDALKGELGIFSNHYGGGSSAPIIRGQEGKRIKVLQNSGDVVDMSAMSPDHAVMVDTTVAKAVQVVRGAGSLLYGSGNVAGVVNVIDDKIPTAMPDGLDGQLGVRYNTAGNETLVTTSLNLGLGDKVVLHIEGLSRNAGDYNTPDYPYYQFDNEKALQAHLSAPDKLASLEKEYEHYLANRHHVPYFPHRPKPEEHYIRKEQDYFDKKQKLENAIVAPRILDYLPESWAKSQSGTLGLSWIGERGYIGASLTHRQDRYGLPAHNPMYEGCGAYVISIASERTKPYLMSYPQLMGDDDVNYINPRADCLSAKDFDTSKGHTHSHDRTHTHGTPHIDLTHKRYELRGELAQPASTLSWLDKVRGSVSHTDYHHQEKSSSSINADFANQATTARLEFTHAPIGKTNQLTGVWGVQYAHSSNHALAPSVYKGRQMLNDNTTKNTAIFGLEKYQWRDVIVELSARAEQQTITMNYDLNKIISVMQPHPNRYNSPYIDKANAERAVNLAHALADTKPYKDNAYSYALGVHWQFLPDYKLSFGASHQERLPNAQELYTHGMHLATNSFEVGNKNLTKEKVNAFELGVSHQGDKLDFKLGGYYYDFDNYIYLETLNENLGTSRVLAPYSLKINRYNQAKASFYGLEGNIGYQFSPIYHGAIFGDMIDGKLHDLPAIVTEYDRTTGKKTYTAQPDMPTPRLPPMRLGTRFKADFDDKWSGELEYYRVFAQDKLSKFESTTPSHDMLNLTINYDNFWQNSDYQIFFKANNLLNQSVYAHETFLPYIPQMGRNFSLGVNVKF